MKTANVTLLAALVLTTGCAAGTAPHEQDSAETGESNIEVAAVLGIYTGPKVQIKNDKGKLVDLTIMLRIRKGHDKFSIDNECSDNTFGFEIWGVLADGSRTNMVSNFFGTPNKAGVITFMNVGTNDCIGEGLLLDAKLDAKARTITFGSKRALSTNDGITTKPLPANSVFRRTK